MLPVQHLLQAPLHLMFGERAGPLSNASIVSEIARLKAHLGAKLDGTLARRNSQFANTCMDLLCSSMKANELLTQTMFSQTPNLNPLKKIFADMLETQKNLRRETMQVNAH